MCLEQPESDALNRLKAWRKQMPILHPDGEGFQVQVKTLSGNIICPSFLWLNTDLIKSQNVPWKALMRAWCNHSTGDWKECSDHTPSSRRDAGLLGFAQSRQQAHITGVRTIDTLRKAVRCFQSHPAHQEDQLFILKRWPSSGPCFLIWSVCVPKGGPSLVLSVVMVGGGEEPLCGRAYWEVSGSPGTCPQNRYSQSLPRAVGSLEMACYRRAWAAPCSLALCLALWALPPHTLLPCCHLPWGPHQRQPCTWTFSFQNSNQ